MQRLSKQPIAQDLWHPRVLVIYFTCVLVLVMAAFEPVCCALALICGLLVGFRLRGVRATLQPLAWQLPLMIIICLINPFFSAQGMTAIAAIGVRTIYLESLAYGLNMGGMLVAMLVWFADAAAVVSTDTVRTAFGGFLPVVSLMISMATRLVPDFVRRGREISDVQSANTSAVKTGTPTSNLATRSRLVTVLVGWGLEDSFTTADSMRARGWSSSHHRTFYQRRRFRTRDGVALGLLAALVAVDASAFTRICSAWHYYPTMGLLAPWPCYLPHAVLLILPLAVLAIEDLRWAHAEATEGTAA